jgi:hypothetical protein
MKQKVVFRVNSVDNVYIFDDDDVDDVDAEAIKTTRYEVELDRKKQIR